MAVELNSFFQAIAERHQESHRKENHLSDVTYALCQSDEAFKQFFLDFFFGNGKINACREKVEITRELSFDEGRPDFSICVGDKDIYLVEVKIWDGKHHFAQYMDILVKEHKCKEEDERGRLGYIANYKINVSDLSDDDKTAYEIVCDNGRTVRTWKEFVGRLESYKNFNDSVISGYVQYVRSICPFDDFELAESTVIKLTDFREVSHFINGLALKIKDMAKEGVFPYNSSRKFSSQGWMGHFFELHNFEDEKSAWGWVGANYTQNGAVVFVEFENRDGWGKPVCELFRSLPFKGDLRFYLNDNSVSWNEFFEGVIAFVKAKGELPCPSFVSLSLDGAKRIESLLVMKSLPWLMDRFFLASSNKQMTEFSEANNKWMVSSSDTENGDSETQGSHCGRYYVLTHDGQKIIEFWLGAFFNKTLRTESGDKFSKQPRFLFDISIEDYEHLPLDMDKTGWYEIKEWKRAVREITLDNRGSKFSDIVNSVVEVLKEIIHGYVQSSSE